MKLRVTSDGTRLGTRIVDVDTGVDFSRRVRSIRIRATAPERPRLILELLILKGDEIDFVVDGLPAIMETTPADAGNAISRRTFRLTVPARSAHTAMRQASGVHRP